MRETERQREREPRPQRGETSSTMRGSETQMGSSPSLALSGPCEWHIVEMNDYEAQDAAWGL